MEDISKTAVGNRLCFDLVIASAAHAAEIDPRGLITKSSSFTLDSNAAACKEIHRRCVFCALIYRHSTTSPGTNDCADCASLHGACQVRNEISPRNRSKACSVRLVVYPNYCML